MSRTNRIKSQASEKITLAQLTGVRQLTHWTSLGGGVYSQQVDHYVQSVNFDKIVTLTGVETTPAAGEYYFNPLTNELQIHLGGSADPATGKVIVRFLLAYSTAPVTLSADLSDEGAQLPYAARIKDAPGFSFKIGIEQDLIAQIGGGSLRLQNADGALDSIYDRLHFENQECEIYSWFRDLPYSEAKVIYRGVIESKRKNADEVQFVLKDRLFSLAGAIPQEVFTADDDVPSNAVGRLKRNVYGRVDGLQVQTISAIGDGYLIGVVSGTTGGTTITGSGTTFLTDVKPNDTIIVQEAFGWTKQWTVRSVNSNTSITVSSDLDETFNNYQAFIKPARASKVRNRTHLIAGHGLSEPTLTVVKQLSTRRIELDDVSEITAGDRIYFNALGIERFVDLVDSVNSEVKLTQFIFETVPVGSTAVRRPVNTVHVDGELVPNDLYTVTNSSSGAELNLMVDVEFELAVAENTPVSLTFTNSSRNVSGTEGDKLDQLLRPGDYIQPSGTITWYEVLSVTDDTIVLTTTFSGTTGSKSSKYKNVEYISDTTAVTVNCYGGTVDGTPTSKWLKTTTDVMQHILNEVGINPPDENFEEAAEDATQTVSLMIPLSPGGKSTKAKEIFDLLAQSTDTVITLDNDLQAKAVALIPSIPRDVETIRDTDIIDWSLRSVGADASNRALVRYRNKDIGEADVAERSNLFVFQILDVINTADLDRYVYDELEAEILASRYLHRNALSRTDVELTSDLRLEVYEVGQVVVLDIRDLPIRLGGDTREQAFIIIGKSVTGDRIKLNLTNLGQNFNRACHITENSAPDYSASDDREKLENGFFTDDEGSVNNDTDTVDLNLIS